MRQQRKLDHVRLALDQIPGGNGLADLSLVHDSLPELDLTAIDLQTALLGVSLPRPVIINAMTGGAAGAGEINRQLAAVARDLGLAMAVGSQRAGLHDPALAGTYTVVRAVNPDGVVLANLGAGASVAEARQAMAMVGADLLQVHLNAPQELVMPEGDRNFCGQLAAIARLVEAGLPVVVKECGFGLSRGAAARLYDAGVRAVDVSGFGGTNFALIEAQRGGNDDLDPGLTAWGIPTAASLVEVLDGRPPDLAVVASGGVARGSEAAAALALGAQAVALAGPVLRALQQGGLAGCRAYLERFLLELNTAALLSGAGSLAALQQKPVVITGHTAQWCHARGIDVRHWGRRGD